MKQNSLRSFSNKCTWDRSAQSRDKRLQEVPPKKTPKHGNLHRICGECLAIVTINKSDEDMAMLYT